MPSRSRLRHVHFEVGGREVELDFDGRVACDDDEVHTPKIHHRVALDGGIFVMTDEGATADVTVPRRERNLLRIEPTCEVGWVVEVSEPHASEGEGYEHDRFHVLRDRLVTAADTDRFFEVDPESGAIEHSWPSTSFRLRGRRVDFSHPVAYALAADGVTVVVTWSGGDDPTRRSKTHVYGFDEDGERLWETTAAYHLWYTAVEDGEVRLWKSDRKPTVRLDPRTGERL